MDLASQGGHGPQPEGYDDDGYAAARPRQDGAQAATPDARGRKVQRASLREDYQYDDVALAGLAVTPARTHNGSGRGPERRRGMTEPRRFGSESKAALTATPFRHTAMRSHASADAEAVNEFYGKGAMRLAAAGSPRSSGGPSLGVAGRGFEDLKAAAAAAQAEPKGKEKSIREISLAYEEKKRRKATASRSRKGDLRSPALSERGEGGSGKPPWARSRTRSFTRIEFMEASRKLPGEAEGLGSLGRWRTRSISSVSGDWQVELADPGAAEPHLRQLKGEKRAVVKDKQQGQRRFAAAEGGVGGRRAAAGNKQNKSSDWMEGLGSEQDGRSEVSLDEFQSGVLDCDGSMNEAREVHAAGDKEHVSSILLSGVKAGTRVLQKPASLAMRGGKSMVHGAMKNMGNLAGKLQKSSSQRRLHSSSSGLLDLPEGEEKEGSVEEGENDRRKGAEEEEEREGEGEEEEEVESDGEAGAGDGNGDKEGSQRGASRVQDAMPAAMQLTRMQKAYAVLDVQHKALQNLNRTLMTRLEVQEAEQVKLERQLEEGVQKERALKEEVEGVKRLWEAHLRAKGKAQWAGGEQDEAKAEGRTAGGNGFEDKSDGATSMAFQVLERMGQARPVNTKVDSSTLGVMVLALSQEKRELEQQLVRALTDNARFAAELGRLSASVAQLHVVTEQNKALEQRNKRLADEVEELFAQQEHSKLEMAQLVLDRETLEEKLQRTLQDAKLASGRAFLEIGQLKSRVSELEAENLALRAEVQEGKKNQSAFLPWFGWA